MNRVDRLTALLAGIDSLDAATAETGQTRFRRMMAWATVAELEILLEYRRASPNAPVELEVAALAAITAAEARRIEAAALGVDDPGIDPERQVREARRRAAWFAWADANGIRYVENERGELEPILMPAEFDAACWR